MGGYDNAILTCHRVQPARVPLGLTRAAAVCQRGGHGAFSKTSIFSSSIRIASTIAGEGFSSEISRENVSPFRLQLSVGCLTPMDKWVATAHPLPDRAGMSGGHRTIA